MKRRDKIYVYGAMLEAALLVTMAAVAQTADGNEGCLVSQILCRDSLTG